jgi:hypothetical protein
MSPFDGEMVGSGGVQMGCGCVMGSPGKGASLPSLPGMGLSAVTLAGSLLTEYTGLLGAGAVGVQSVGAGVCKWVAEV